MSLECQYEKLIITNVIDHIISQNVRLYIRQQDKQGIEIALKIMKQTNKGLKWRFEAVKAETS